MKKNEEIFKKPLTYIISPLMFRAGYRLEIAKNIGLEAFSHARGRGLVVFCRLWTVRIGYF